MVSQSKTKAKMRKFTKLARWKLEVLRENIETMTVVRKSTPKSEQQVLDVPTSTRRLGLKEIFSQRMDPKKQASHSKTVSKFDLKLKTDLSSIKDTSA